MNSMAIGSRSFHRWMQVALGVLLLLWVWVVARSRRFGLPSRAQLIRWPAAPNRWVLQQLTMVPNMGAGDVTSRSGNDVEYAFVPWRDTGLALSAPILRVCSCAYLGRQFAQPFLRAHARQPSNRQAHARSVRYFLSRVPKAIRLCWLPSCGWSSSRPTPLSICDLQMAPDHALPKLVLADKKSPGLGRFNRVWRLGTARLAPRAAWSAAMLLALYRVGQAVLA